MAWERFLKLWIPSGHKFWNLGTNSGTNLELSGMPVGTRAVLGRCSVGTLFWPKNVGKTCFCRHSFWGCSVGTRSDSVGTPRVRSGNDLGTVWERPGKGLGTIWEQSGMIVQSSFGNVACLKCSITILKVWHRFVCGCCWFG